MIQKLRILDVATGAFVAKDGVNAGQSVKYTTLIVKWLGAGEVVSRLKCSKDFDFTPYVGEDVDAELVVNVDRNMNPSLRCMGIAG